MMNCSDEIASDAFCDPSHHRKTDGDAWVHAWIVLGTETLNEIWSANAFVLELETWNGIWSEIWSENAFVLGMETWNGTWSESS